MSTASKTPQPQPASEFLDWFLTESQDSIRRYFDLLNDPERLDATDAKSASAIIKNLADRYFNLTAALTAAMSVDDEEDPPTEIDSVLLDEFLARLDTPLDTQQPINECKNESAKIKPKTAPPKKVRRTTRGPTKRQTKKARSKQKSVGSARGSSKSGILSNANTGHQVSGISEGMVALSGKEGP